MSANTTNLGLPYLASGQAQKHVTVNESLRRLDALTQLSVESADVANQPGAPEDGQCYILPAGKTGAAWGAMAEGAIAYYRDGFWEEITPRAGWIAAAKDSGQLFVRAEEGWRGHNAVTSGLCQGRLTLTSGAPVMTSDVYAAEQIYFSPYNGNQISLYEAASGWRACAFSETGLALTETQTGALTSGAASVVGLSDTRALAVGMGVAGAGVPSGATIAAIVSDTEVTLSAAATATGSGPLTFTAPANTNVDVFAFLRAGALALEMTFWSSATARAVALALQDGVRVRSGAPTRRYLGTVRTVAAGQCEFSMRPAAAAGGSHPKLFVWNAANRTPIAAVCRDSTDTWTYTLATLRPANNSNANRVSFVIGDAEGVFAAAYVARADNTHDDVYRLIGVGYDSTTALAEASLSGQSEGKAGRPGPQLLASLARPCEPGAHYVQALEFSTAAGATTWFGDGGAPSLLQTGLTLALEM